MARTGRRPEDAAHDSRATSRAARHHRRIWLLVLVPLLVAVAVGAAAFASARRSAMTSAATSHGIQTATAPTQPADLFMQSLVTENGDLGWHQLCPDIQARLPRDSLVQQADAMRAAAAQEGVRLTVESVGTRPQQGGWLMHVYRMTAHWTSGAMRQWTYDVLTQPSGCVEDIQGQ